jgi:MFS family permease
MSPGPTSDKAIPPSRASAFAAFASPNYRLYVAGFLCSSSTLQMLATAVGWEVYERTRDPLQLGYVGLARALPVVLLALFAGHLADVWDRRRLLVITQAGFAVGAAALGTASLHQAPLWTLYVILVLTGCCRAFNGPARNSLLPLLVPGRVFQNAVTWNANAFQLSAIAGPVVGGLIIAWTGAAWPVYAATAAGTLVFAAAVFFTRPAPQQRVDAGFSPAEFFAGAAHIRRERTIFGAISLDMLAVFFGGATALLPVFAGPAILNAGPVALGALRSAVYVGALLMGLWLARHHEFRRAGPALLWSVAGFGVATIVFGLSTNLWLSLAALVVAGAFDQVSVVIRHVLVQTRTPDHLRGRVSAVNSVFIECSNELGGFESGLVAHWFGPVFSVVSGGVGTLLVVAGIAAGVPELRGLRSPK